MSETLSEDKRWGLKMKSGLKGRCLGGDLWQAILVRAVLEGWGIWDGGGLWVGGQGRGSGVE